jgi:uncharacterized protein YjiS (DUF1127 family)
MIMQTNTAQPLTGAGITAGDAIEQRLTVISRAARRLATVLRAIAEENGRRRAIRELRLYDNHRLADLGIKRADIERAVRGGRGAL